MNTHIFGTNTFAIFEKKSSGDSASLQFIWGKKDFKIFLNPASNVSKPVEHTPKLLNPKKVAWVVRNLQFLNQFEWYDYVKVAGHGLDNEEVLWRNGRRKHYVDLPKRFLKTAVELAILEFDLKKVHTEVAA